MNGIEPHPIAILIGVWQIFTLPWSFGGMIWPEFSSHGPRIGSILGQPQSEEPGFVLVEGFKSPGMMETKIRTIS